MITWLQDPGAQGVVAPVGEDSCDLQAGVTFSLQVKSTSGAATPGTFLSTAWRRRAAVPEGPVYNQGFIKLLCSQYMDDYRGPEFPCVGREVP